MMNNLFSMFDPSTSTMSTVWLISMASVILISLKNPMMLISKKSTSLKILKSGISSEISSLMSTTEKKMTSKTLVSLFMVLLMANMMALMPFNFTIAAHIPISLGISLSMWLMVMINGLINSTKKMILHLTPMGTPPQLMNFMVLIETVSMTIRPITLCVRLSANMVAGHLLMSLLSNFSMTSMQMSFFSLAPMVVLISLESAVAVIQAYVITVLITLYYNESF